MKKIFSILLLLFYSCNGEYNTFKHLEKSIVIGKSYQDVYNKINKLPCHFSFPEKKDTILFEIIVEGPIESSEQLYLTFNKDSILIQKKLVH